MKLLLNPKRSSENRASRSLQTVSKILAIATGLVWGAGLLVAAETMTIEIRHSYLVLGTKTAIIREDGSTQWEYRGGSRDGFVLPSGNVLIAFADRVEEVVPAGKGSTGDLVVFSYRRSKENGEIATAQRLYNGNTMVAELGVKPRLLEVNSRGEVIAETPLQPETENTHMQTRMARQLKNGNFLVPHLLAFAIKEYHPSGLLVDSIKTDSGTIGGRKAENWPFTAIRLDNGNTVASLTHGNQVVEFDNRGEIVWKITNTEVNGLFKDPCGVQRLANGNTVVGSHGANEGISMVEVTPSKKMVWTSDHPLAAGVHHFQILTTNGKPEPGMPLK